MDEIRIDHIITGLETGGAEMMLRKLLEQMEPARFRSRVISLTDSGTMGRAIEGLGVPVETCGMKPGRLAPGGFRRLLAFLRKDRPQIVQTWLYHADLLGGIAGKMAGVPHVLWNVRHGNLDPHRNKRTTLWTVRLNARLSRRIPQAIICNSRQAMQTHIAAGFASDRFILIPNGFDCSKFAPCDAARKAVRDELGITATAPLVGMIARFDQQKNHEGFIAAAKIVASARTNTHFLLAGRGIVNENSQLTGWIAAAGLRERVHLLGERRDVPRLLASLDVAVSASHGEAFPNAVGEAMASGVPCVVTDVGDCAEIVGDSGFIAASGDVNAFASHILHLLAMPATERQMLGQRARQRILSSYSIEAVSARYEALYRTISG